MSTITHAPQLRLPGQTHVAEGPHDHTGMYVMHHAFRRDLDQFTSAVRATPVGESLSWRLLDERFARFAHALHHHHTTEDEHYWPRLQRAAEQRGDERDLASITDNSGEHAEIDPCLDQCTRSFAEMSAHPCEDHRNALDLRLAGFGELLLDHMAHEEQEVLPLVQRVMTEEEFAAAEKAVADSYAVKDAPFIVAWAMHELPSEARARMFAIAGTPYRVLHALVRRRFERLEARTFRYAEPSHLD